MPKILNKFDGQFLAIAGDPDPYKTRHVLTINLKDILWLYSLSLSLIHNMNLKYNDKITYKLICISTLAFLQVNLVYSVHDSKLELLVVNKNQ